MSVRTDIISALESDFETITVANGYNNTINSVLKQSANLSQVDTSLMDFVYLISLPASQDPNETNMWEWNVGFEIYFKTSGIDSDNDGLMRAKAESYIEDVMTLFENPANSLALETIESLYIDSIEPYDQNSSADVGIVYGLIKIKFIFP